MRALASINLKNCINARGKMSIAYHIARRNGYRYVKDLSRANLNQLKTFFTDRPLKDLLLAGLPNPVTERIRDDDKLLFPYQGRFELITKLNSKEIRMSEREDPHLIFKSGAIMSPTESLTYFNQLKKLTSVRHRNTLLRVLHGDVYTNERLYRFGLRDDPNCTRCNETDTLEHRLVSCRGTENLRTNIVNVTSKLYKTINAHQLDPLDQILVTHKDSSSAILTVHAELLYKIAISTTEIQPDSRGMLKGIIKSIAKRESSKEVIKDLQTLLD